MGNFHTAWTTERFKASSMDVVPTDLDKAITYLKNIIVHCDGNIDWASGCLTWDDIIRINFTSAAGLSIQNTIPASHATLTDAQFLYVDLNETPASVLTHHIATLATSGVASNDIAFNRLVLGYRNTDSDEFYPVYLRPKWSAISASHTRLHAMNSASDHTGYEDYLSGIEFSCATSSTTMNINWANGDQAYATLSTPANVRMTGSRNGHVYRLRLAQPAAIKAVLFKDAHTWEGGSTAATASLSTIASHQDFITMVRSNGAWYMGISHF